MCFCLEFAVPGHYQPGMFIVEVNGIPVDPNNTKALEIFNEPNRFINIKVVKLPPGFRIAFDGGSLGSENMIT